MLEGREECSSCGTFCRPNARFCHECGVPVWPLRNCEHCDEPTPANGVFCDQCGGELECGHADGLIPAIRKESVKPAEVDPGEAAEVIEEAPEPGRQPTLIELIAGPAKERRATAGRTENADAERRVVTVMFADISGFTSISENLEPEDVSEIMNTVFDSMTDIIVEHGGTIDKYIGDCVMALFGAPRAYGDDAERAARAALQMQDAITSLADRFEVLVGGRLQMRIGLNTGMVMAGYVGGQGHQNYTVMGDAVNVASRMETACETGRILVASNTRRAIAERFVVSDAGRFDVKGKSEPVDAYYVERERTGALSDMGSFFEGVPIPFVGRSEQLDAMKLAFAKAEEHRRAYVVKLTGPVGSGKSRILSEFSRCTMKTSPETLLLYGRSTRSTGGLMEPLKQGLNLALSEQWGSVQEALSALFEEESEAIGAEHDDGDLGFKTNLMELLDAFLSGGELFVGAGEQSLSVRRTLFWALAQLIVKMCADRSALIVISDAHMADEALTDFVSFLIDSAAPAVPALVMWEMQTTPATRQRARRLFEGELTGMVELQPLEDEDISVLLRAMLAPLGTVPSWVADWILERSEGRPLYILEHVRSLRSLDLLKIDQELGTWSMSETRPDENVLPPSIYAALQAELDGRHPNERLVLQRAAVVGRVFWDLVMQQLCRGVLADYKIERALRSLRVAGILHERATTVVDGAAEYRFSSELFQQVCYDSLLHRERSQLHADVARVLAAVDFDVEPTLLARHYRLAERPTQAVECLLRAAESQLLASSLSEAEEVLVTVAEILQDRSVVAAKRVAQRDQRVRYHRARAELLRQRGRLDAALAEVDRAFEVLGYPERRRDEAELQSNTDYAGLYTIRGQVFQTRANYREAVTAFEEALGRLSDIDVEVCERVSVRASIAWNLLKLEEVEEARTISQAVVTKYEGETLDEPALANAVARHHDTLGQLAFVAEDYQVAFDFYVQARDLRLIDGNVALLAHSEGNLAGASAMLGEWELAARAFERVISQWITLGNVELVCISRLNLTECLLELCERTESADLARAIHSQASRELDRADELVEMLDAGSLRTPAADLRRRLEVNKKHELTLVR